VGHSSFLLRRRSLTPSRKAQDHDPDAESLLAVSSLDKTIELSSSSSSSPVHREPAVDADVENMLQDAEEDDPVSLSSPSK
jgi:hypothetical protein